MGEADDAQRRHALQATLEGCDRATRLVEQLLTLSRLEAVDALDQGTLDLAALARRVTGELAPKAATRRQVVEFDALEPCPVTGNETLLAVLVRNLVDNALRYSPAAAKVTVAVRHEGGRVVLRVEDSGPGLAEADRARLGERFFRLPGSEQSGSGLGWSIVRRIAAVHRISLHAGASALGGLAVSVEFPPAAA